MQIELVDSCMHRNHKVIAQIPVKLGKLSNFFFLNQEHDAHLCTWSDVRMNSSSSPGNTRAIKSLCLLSFCCLHRNSFVMIVTAFVFVSVAALATQALIHKHNYAFKLPESHTVFDTMNDNADLEVSHGWADTNFPLQKCVHFLWERRGKSQREQYIVNSGISTVCHRES